MSEALPLFLLKIRQHCVPACPISAAVFEILFVITAVKLQWGVQYEEGGQRAGEWNSQAYVESPSVCGL